MYGLLGALLKWYTRVRKFVNDSKIDPSLFIWYNTKVVVGLMANHIHDFLYTGDNGFIKSLVSFISRRQIVLNIWNNIKREENIITINHENYVDHLLKIDTNRSEIEPNSFFDYIRNRSFTIENRTTFMAM